MKQRSREINVFSMSLLDILCGAMGAFAFLFILVLPDYHPGANLDTKDMVDPQTYEEAMERIRQLEEELQSQQGKSADQEKQIRQLQLRDPIVILSTFYGAADMDLYVVSPGLTNDNRPQDPPDPRKKQPAFWIGTEHVPADEGPATEAWLIRDTPVGDFEVYYKLMTDTAPAQAVIVRGTVMSAIDPYVYLPQVSLSKPRELVHVATITMQSDSHIKVKALVPGQ